MYVSRGKHKQEGIAVSVTKHVNLRRVAPFGFAYSFLDIRFNAPRCMLMCLDVGSVHKIPLVVDLVQAFDMLKQGGPNAIFRPSVEAIVNTLPRTER